MSDGMDEPPLTGGPNEQVWRSIFDGGNRDLQRLRLWENVPSPPRCVLCAAPFAGIGGALLRFTGRRQNVGNPRYCNDCDQHLENYPGGAYARVSILYADIRGSTAMSERSAGADYKRLLDGFYDAVGGALIKTGGFVFERQGDSVFGVYPRGFCGDTHALEAIKGARHLLADMRPRMPDGSPLPIGIGVHTGTVFVATMSRGGEGTRDPVMRDIGMAGDQVTVAARLSKLAHGGEALVSDAARRAAGDHDFTDAEPRPQLKLEGRQEPVDALALRAPPSP
jgi:adenylate cyclase